MVRQKLQGVGSVVNCQQNTLAQVVSLRDQTKMGAKAGVTVKVMPEGTDIDLEALKVKARELVNEIYGDVGEIRIEEEPIAFGLRALKVTFIIDEDMGSDPIEQKLSELEEVASAQVIAFERLT